MEPVAVEDEGSLVLELRRTLARLELALAQIPDGLVITDPEGCIIWCNGGFESLIGRSRLFLLGQKLAGLMPSLVPAERRINLNEVLKRWPEGSRQTVVRQRDPLQVLSMEWRPVLSDNQGEVPYIFRFHDISDRISLEEMRHQQLNLAALVVTCPVTGLPNRRGLLQALEEALAGFTPDEGCLAVLFCDLNRFKEVNDVYGHRLGDQLLIEVAHRMQATLRPHDLVSRIGGDEFVLLCRQVASAHEAQRIAQRVIAAVARPWSPADAHLLFELEPAISVGIALCDREGCSAEELLHQADLAMYEAKNARSTRPVVFDQALAARFSGQQRIRALLQQIVDSQKLPLHLQPLVRLSDGQVVGYEVLCRPQDQQGLSIAPQHFIEAVEAAGLITPIGSLLLNNSLELARRLQLQGRDRFLSINISGQQLRHPQFADQLLAALDDHGVPAQVISLELSEAVLLDQSEGVLSELSRLRSRGVRLLIDDFGLGSSSLNGLVALPIDGLKVDPAFTANLSRDPRRRLLVEAVVRLAAELDLQLIAEGVESCAERQLLMEMGFELAQGFLFASPEPIDSILANPDHAPLGCEGS